MAGAHNDFDAFIHPFLGTDIAHTLRERAGQHGERAFLIWAPFDGAAETWTWTRFEDEAARLAGGLLHRGVGAGDRVFIQLENCPETLVARFACAWIGAIAVLANPALTAPETRDLVEASGARAAITQPRLRDALASCPGIEWIAVTATDAGAAPATPVAREEAFAALMGERAPARAPDPLAPAMILFTTGTTSRAKGVLWTHANVLWGARMAAMQQCVRGDDIYHVFLPLFHVVGFSWSFLGAFFAGASVLLQPRFSGSRFWDAAIAHRATLSSQVKFTSNVLSQNLPPRHFFRQWTTANHTPAYAQRFGVREVSAWGMTEMVAQGMVGDPWSAQPARSVGRPSLAYRIHIEDDAGRPVAPGETGHLFVTGVRGLSIFREYDGAAQATSDAFDDRGRFITGDRVTLLQDGWIEFADRTKDVIKVGGEGVSGGEIEGCIAQVAGVREVAVVGKPDDTWGEAIVAFVIAGAGADADSLRETIAAHCAASLAKFKRPAEIRMVEDFPRIGFGKIAKVKLRDMLKSEKA
ncbi:MAG: class I adenylate-forming enzyme family protein [Beijerinckiaceae bacterium]